MTTVESDVWMAKYWCASWGVRPGNRYRIRRGRKAVEGTFIKVSPRGHLVFRDADNEYIMDLKCNPPFYLKRLDVA